MSRADNPSAFPIEAPFAADRGMTLRDWFAGQVDVSAYHPAASYEQNHGRAPTVNELAEYIAGIRMIEADAMLAERAKGGAA